MEYEKYLFHPLDMLPKPQLKGRVVASFKEAEDDFEPLFNASAKSKNHDYLPDSAPAPRQFSEAELEEARTKAYDEGFMAGQYQGLEQGRSKGADETRKQLETEHKDALDKAVKEAVDKAVTRHHHAMEAAMQSLNLQIMQAWQEAQEANDADVQDWLNLVWVVAEKLAGSALHAMPEAPLRAMLFDFASRHRQAPTITVEVAEDLLPLAIETIDHMRKSGECDAEISCKAGAGLQGSDCRIKWQNGRMEHSLDSVAQEIQQLIAATIATQITSHSNDEENPNG